MHSWNESFKVIKDLNLQTLFRDDFQNLSDDRFTDWDVFSPQELLLDDLWIKSQSVVVVGVVEAQNSSWMLGTVVENSKTWPIGKAVRASDNSFLARTWFNKDRTNFLVLLANKTATILALTLEPMLNLCLRSS
ncbi:hypothetical protein WICPIJ_006255 [Wickerhamomyces pijperi]|uniref:Uncharacterized protein n=1 Tax=Wickerhamomyces pijperi TaxID=599730 RepID=A0A9P8Q2G3_WICPI|nr:hypothetical protein WICPIJ_006255 [Wickerhamomyces pijperi]